MGQTPDIPTPLDARAQDDVALHREAGVHQRGWGPKARYAIFVDVGYVFGAAAQLLVGSPERRRVRVDVAALVGRLAHLAREEFDSDPLRLYWFDGARDRVPTVEQRVVARLAGVKVRLGNVNAAGQQKGVDALLRADLESLARNRAISDVVLVSGDEDMLPAVEAAQSMGVRAHLWGIQPEYGRNVAERLEWEVDSFTTLGPDALEGLFTALQPRPAPTEPPASPQAEPAPASTPTPATAVPATQAAPAPAAAAAAAAAGVPSPAALAGVRRAGDGARPGARRDLPVYTSETNRPSVQAPGFDDDAMLEAGEAVAAKWVIERGKDNLADLLPGRPMLPAVIDQELLIAAESVLGFSLRSFKEGRTLVRDGFWERLDAELGLRRG